MSQRYVERIIGLLATDEALRQEFTKNPKETLLKLSERGMELSSCELGSLATLDPEELKRFAQILDSRLQKADLQRGET
jgi:hypothetical protein